MVVKMFRKESPDQYVARGREAPVVTQLPGLPEAHLFNSGDARALDELPGIGAVLAGRIIEERECVGPYFFPEDLMLVKGIGEKRYQDAMDFLAGQETTPGDLNGK